jgi:ankyrin repeat protein
MKILLVACTLAALAAALPEAGEKTRKLLDSIRKGDATTVRALVESDPAIVNTREGDLAAVRLAMYYRQPEIARYLIDQGATLDFYDAAAAGHLGRLRELLASDRSLVNSYSSDGATPLGLAAFFGHEDAVELLLEDGAQINTLAKNPAFPFAPLHSAMSAGHKDIVLLLLARGADVNVREGGGITVLHEAAGLGIIEYVNLLLAHGADPGARTDDGKLPEDFARDRKFPKVTDLLERARLGR